MPLRHYEFTYSGRIVVDDTTIKTVILGVQAQLHPGSEPVPDEVAQDLTMQLIGQTPSEDLLRQILAGSIKSAIMGNLPGSEVPFLTGEVVVVGDTAEPSAGPAGVGPVD